MSDPVAAREALIIEAIGEAARLIESVERLAPEIQEMGREIDRATACLHDALAAFEARITASTEKAKEYLVSRVVARTEDAARRSIALQGQAMADAARVAFAAELGTTVQRLRTTAQALLEPRGNPWEPWLTHAAAAAVASAATWGLVLYLGQC